MPGAPKLLLLLLARYTRDWPPHGRGSCPPPACLLPCHGCSLALVAIHPYGERLPPHDTFDAEAALAELGASSHGRGGGERR